MTIEVYSKCTVCCKHLEKEDIEENIKHENYYVPICNDCLEKGIQDLSEKISFEDD